MNYRFQLKYFGILAACFRWSGIKGVKCYVTIILKTTIVRIDVANYIEPFEISNLNWKHIILYYYNILDIEVKDSFTSDI